jgi:hypothetical protein
VAGDDWAAETADTIDRFVGAVRGKTTGPLERAARILVYGVLAAIVGTVALVLVLITVVRVVDVVLPGEVWSAYLLLGGIFTGAGLFMWRKRDVRPVRA